VKLITEHTEVKAQENLLLPMKKLSCCLATNNCQEHNSSSKLLWNSESIYGKSSPKKTISSFLSWL